MDDLGRARRDARAVAAPGLEDEDLPWHRPPFSPSLSVPPSESEAQGAGDGEADGAGPGDHDVGVDRLRERRGFLFCFCFSGFDEV